MKSNISLGCVDISVLESDGGRYREAGNDSIGGLWAVARRGYETPSDPRRRLAALADVTGPLIGPGAVRRRLPLAVGKLAWWPVRNLLSLKTELC